MPPAIEPTAEHSGMTTGVPFAPDLHDARHLWLKAVLLLLWLLVTFVTSFFARDLSLPFGGWTFGYWMAAQGAVLVFIVLTIVYCGAMDRFERADADAAAPPPRHG
ncbi:DUF4212 domain-containing protein [Acidovorax sp. HDW3]|uniref:DUF4212 domain-containing protein n=1 Tax=Acidovorax sp. HDW3 TaxID=2714923 RepID=UPI00197A906E|nr:DUF4212 domain-containing protein [Acidovorax sp. HDW3]